MGLFDLLKAPLDLVDAATKTVGATVELGTKPFTDGLSELAGELKSLLEEDE